MKKAQSAILKIAHLEPIAPVESLSDERSDQQQLIAASKFNLLDPLKVLDIFKRVEIKVYIKTKT